MHIGRSFDTFCHVLNQLNSPLKITLTFVALVLGYSALYAGIDSHPELADTSARRERRSERPPVDTLAAQRDTVVIKLYLPRSTGSVDPLVDSSLVITRPALQWLDHRALPDLIEYLPGVMIRDQSSPGQYAEPTVDGIDWRGIGVLWNGRTLADPVTGVYNLHLAATDYLERLEYISGPRAFLYGSNSTGGTLNLITRNYNSNRAFTRLRYAQSGYGYALTDGTFAQNISRRVNVTAGFQFQGSDGRYPNSQSDAWNIRGKVRFGLADNLTLTLSEYFTSTNTDLNGGIKFDSNGSGLSLTPTAAVVVNTDSYEKITRHDLDMTFVGGFLPDSEDVSTLTIYTSQNLREYRDEENRPYPNGVFIQSDHQSVWTGMQLTQLMTINAVHFLAGGMIESRHVEQSPNLGNRMENATAIWAKGEGSLGDVLTLATYGRLDRYLGFTKPGIGADARLSFDSSLSIFGGLSTSHRIPNLMERYWTDSTVVRVGSIEPERHFVTEVGLQFSFPGGTTGRFAITHRLINNPILLLPYDRPSVFPGITFVNGDREEMTTADVSLSLRWWHLLLEGTGTYFINRSGATLPNDLPRVALYGGLYFRDKLVSGNLDLKAGIRGWYRSGSWGMVFNPEIVAYVPNTEVPLGRSATVDLVVIAHLGDAYVDLVWENLPNIVYYATPYYPGLDREIRLTVGWDFWN